MVQIVTFRALGHSHKKTLLPQPLCHGPSFAETFNPKIFVNADNFMSRPKSHSVACGCLLKSRGRSGSGL